MAIIDLFQSSLHRNNMAHFSAIVNIAMADGIIDPKEEAIIKRFARKLDITDKEQEEIFENPKKYPVIPQLSSESRLERIFDLFRTINSDGDIDESEKKLILKYTIQLGTPLERAEAFIDKCVKIFSGNIDFETFKAVLKLM